MTGIREVHERATATAGVRETVPTGALPAFFARALAQTAAALDAQGIHPIGPPYGRYYSMPGADVDVEVGFPVSAPVKRTGRVSPGELPGGRVVEALHAGSFDTLSQTYAEVRRYFEEHDRSEERR